MSTKRTTQKDRKTTDILRETRHVIICDLIRNSFNILPIYVTS